MYVLSKVFVGWCVGDDDLVLSFSFLSIGEFIAIFSYA